MNETPVWTAGNAGTAAPEPAALPSRADVAIVGAGYTGLSAALALAKRGLSVAVLESGTVGFGASSRNGGMALTGLKLAPEVLLRRYGAATAREMFSASLEAIDLVESLIASERIECAFDRCGHLELASKAAHFVAFGRTAAALSEHFGHAVRLLGRAELAGEIGSTAFYGGIVDPRSAALDPLRYVMGLAHAARRSGATICERTPVGAVEPVGGQWRLTSSRGELTARNVLLATGAYTGRAFPALRRRLVPIGSYAIASEPLPSSLADAVLPRKRAAFDSMRLLHYFRLTPDRRMLFGGRAAFLPENERTIAVSAGMLRADMVALFPQLAGAKIEYAWGGTLDVTFDVMPHAGTIDGMHYAVGYAGHGVALATLLGKLAADAIAGGARAHPFAIPAPAPPVGFYDGRPWFLPVVGAWQRLLDAVS